MLVYIAAPLFTITERNYIMQIARQIEEMGIKTYVPHRDGHFLPDLLNEHSVFDASNIIFKKDTDAIQKCDIFLILMDGRTIDEGACVELGIAYATQRTCIGLQTDIRRLSDYGNNPMIEGCLKMRFELESNLISYIRGFQ